MIRIEPHVAIIDFHHSRGPEIEFWVDPAAKELFSHNDWNLLPFMALSDGAHAMVEDFSYFTLLHKATSTNASDSSLFGISCMRQIRSEKLKRRSADVTRSTVQKAVVVITDTAQGLGELRQRLGAVTAAWFAQEDFSETEILKDFQESLKKSHNEQQIGREYFSGLSLREMIYEFRNQTLVLVKCLLLQRKMLFFGSKCERLCMIQFALVSLIPGLISNLQDCADPALDTYSRKPLSTASLRTSDRSSLLAYMGLPLDIFGKGSFFGPYTPLQQLDILADYDTKSYVVGSTNSLLLQQKERYSDILINLDESNSVTILSPSLRSALSLSAADRRWIDQLTQTVLDTWDPDNPSRPKNMGYSGSEEAIRLQFEEYILALLSSVAYQVHQEAQTQSISAGISGDPTTETNNSKPAAIASTTSGGVAHGTLNPNTSETAADFNPDFLSTWRGTNNFAIFNQLTSPPNSTASKDDPKPIPIFEILPPHHPTSGGLNIDDFQRRLTQQIADLHLEDRVREGRQTIEKRWASGREKVSKIWNEVRESEGTAAWTASFQRNRPDTTAISNSARENAAKASTYLSSWGSWAKERGKEWQETRKGGGAGSSTIASSSANITSSDGGGGNTKGKG